MGGDFDQKPIHAFGKYVSSEAVAADSRAIDVFNSLGRQCVLLRRQPVARRRRRPRDFVSSGQVGDSRNEMLRRAQIYGSLLPTTLDPHSPTVIYRCRLGRLRRRWRWRLERLDSSGVG